MKVSDKIKNKIEQIFQASHCVYMSDLPAFVHFLENENITPQEFGRLFLAYQTEMATRRYERDKRKTYNLEPLEPFDFEKWAETIK